MERRVATVLTDVRQAINKHFPISIVGKYSNVFSSKQASPQLLANYNSFSPSDLEFFAEQGNSFDFCEVAYLAHKSGMRRRKAREFVSASFWHYNNDFIAENIRRDMKTVLFDEPHDTFLLNMGSILEDIELYKTLEEERRKLEFPNRIGRALDKIL